MFVPAHLRLHPIRFFLDSVAIGHGGPRVRRFVSVQAAGAGAPGESEDWVDLVLGVDVGLLNLDKFSIVARADVGGFGIGNGSDLVWPTTVLVGYDLTPNVALVIGYHVLDYDFETGGGINEFKLDAQLRGPVLAVRIVF